MVTPAHSSGFIIIPTYDTSITSDPNAAAIEGAIQTAINQYESLLTSAVTVTIYFEETTDPQAIGLSQSSLYQVNYQTAYNDLVHNDANSAAVAALTANGGNAVKNPVTGTTTIDGKAPDLRALGFNTPAACQLTPATTQNGGIQIGVNQLCGGTTGPAYDGLIALNTGITYPPQSNNGSNYGLVGTAEHEMDEVLALGSALENCQPGQPNQPTGCTSSNTNYKTTPVGDPFLEDLFRWSAPTGGTRTLSANCATPTSAYFSYGPSTGEIAGFNNSCNGADFGDWAGSSPDRVQDAFGTPGLNPTLGTAELDALTAFGFNEVPEPGTLSFAALACALWICLRNFHPRNVF